MDKDITIEISNIENYTIELNEQGPQGLMGPAGPQGPQGPQGIPGVPGQDGQNGQDGQDATINGYSTATISASGSLVLTQEGSNIDISGSSLQSQIDALAAASDVKDIVGTYTELLAYDTSTLGNNDIVKVLQDSTHDDETTYYRWVITGGVGAWNLIGEEGPYYTIASADATFVPLTRTVNGKALSSNITIDYTDIPNTPTIGNGTITFIQGGINKGTITANQTGNTTIVLDAAGDALPSQTGHDGEFLTTDGTNASWGNATEVIIRRWS